MQKKIKECRPMGGILLIKIQFLSHIIVIELQIVTETIS